MILERLGEDEIQLLTMWILSYIILGVTMPPLGFLLGTDPSEERTQFNGSDGLLPTITLPPLSHDENVDWEVVDLSPAPSTVVLPSLRPAIPVWNSDVAVVEEECEDDSIVWWSPGRRHARSFSRALRRNMVNLQDSLGRVE